MLASTFAGSSETVSISISSSQNSCKRIWSSKEPSIFFVEFDGLISVLATSENTTWKIGPMFNNMVNTYLAF